MKRGFEIRPLTFKGQTWRVQLCVSDYRDGVIESWKSNPVTFCVTRLPNSAHPSTAFITGIQVYYGTDFAVAVSAVEKFTGRLVWPSEFPAQWHRYMHPDSDDFRGRLEDLGMKDAEPMRHFRGAINDMQFFDRVTKKLHSNHGDD